LLAASISALVKPRIAKRSNAGSSSAPGAIPPFDAVIFPQCPFVEGEFDIWSRGERRLARGECGRVNPLVLKLSRLIEVITLS
jgi:hypothetical protein